MTSPSRGLNASVGTTPLAEAFFFEVHSLSLSLHYLRSRSGTYRVSLLSVHSTFISVHRIYWLSNAVMTELSEPTLPSISDFYAHKDVFITGATGFMGKCLLEKLLRSVPELGTVFVLTRSKKEKSPEQRTKDLLNGPVSFTCSFIVCECVHTTRC